MVCELIHVSRETIASRACFVILSLPLLAMAAADLSVVRSTAVCLNTSFSSDVVISAWKSFQLVELHDGRKSDIIKV